MSAAHRNAARRKGKKRRKNPGTTRSARVPLYIIAAQGTGRRMHYDGVKFSERPRVVTFKNARIAKEKARELIATYPILKKYTVWIEPSDTGTARFNNPRAREENFQGLAREAALLEEFSGHKPTEVLRFTKSSKQKGLVIGELDGVLYSTVRDGRHEKYVHHFRKKSRPLLAATNDGTQLEIVGGQFQMTEAGIEDR